MSDVSLTTSAQTGDGRIKTLEELLDEAKVDRSIWRVTKVIVNKWDGILAGGVVEQLIQVKAWLEFLPTVSIKPAQGFPAVIHGSTDFIGSDTETAVFLPDFQIGYEWTPGFDYLDPFHDRTAIDVCIQFLREFKPTYVYILGDFLDLPEFSRFEKSKRGIKYVNTTQPAIEEGYHILRSIREATPHSKLIFIHGNHDARLAKDITTYNETVNYLRPAGDKKPALALDSLLRLQELGFESNGGYDNPVWLWDSVQVRHGEEYANLSASKLAHSVIQGHGHRLVFDVRSICTPDGYKNVYMISPGTLARSAGPIPRKSSVVNWQQGISIGHHPVGKNPTFSILPVTDGHIFYGHKQFIGRSKEILEAEISRVTGIKQFERS